MKQEWKKKRLGEIADVLSGGTPLVSTKAYWDGDLPWYSSGELNALYTSTPKRHISILGLESSNAKLFPKGSLLIGMYDTAALKMSILDREGAFNQAIAGVMPNPHLDLVFVLHGINAIREHILGQRRGVRQKNLSLRKIRDVELFIPPLAEQKRVVAFLDEAFAGLAVVKTNAEKNLKNARAVFDSHLQAVFTQDRNAWKSHSLLSACEIFVDSAHRTPKYQDEGIPALRPRDVVNGKLNFAGAQRVSEAEYEIQSKRHKPRLGDIVYSRELSYGWAALLPASPRVCLSQGMCLFRPSAKLNAAFLLYVLNGPIGREQATRAAVGAAHPHINLGDIKSYSVPLPPMEEQRKITKQLDVLSEETQRLARLYERKLAAIEALKNSLLETAFSRAL